MLIVIYREYTHGTLLFGVQSSAQILLVLGPDHVQFARSLVRFDDASGCHGPYGCAPCGHCIVNQFDRWINAYLDVMLNLGPVS